MEEFEEDRRDIHVAGEELIYAMRRNGIRATVLEDLDDDKVTVALDGIRDAELLLTLAFDGPDAPGSMYDRATSGCVSMLESSTSHPHRHDASDQQVAREIDALVDASWAWVMHPEMSSRRVDWHIVLVLPVADTFAVTANLNTLANGGAL